jgi:cytochrome oxidase Cu insertion factor (SCO1/SenC/PrrC family)
MNRREVISTIAKGAALLVPALPVLTLGSEGNKQAAAACGASPSGRGAHYFPNVTVVNHEGERAVFYRDLIKDKVVVINFMSIAFHEKYPITQNLAGLQDLLGDHLGKDVFMYSITFDPANDTPRALRAFANRFNVKPGWSFLTGSQADVKSIQDRFFTTIDGKTHHGTATNCGADCARGIVRIGNESLGRWTAVPSRSRPEVMAHYFQFMGLEKPLDHSEHMAHKS